MYQGIHLLMLSKKVSMIVYYSCMCTCWSSSFFTKRFNMKRISVMGAMHGSSIKCMNQL